MLKTREKLSREAEVFVELMWRRVKADIFYFIAQFVFIEDRDSKEVAIPFQLWPKQIKALEQMAANRLVIVLKARQLGLTWMVLVYSVWKMLTRHGYSVIALSKKEDPDAKELIRRVKFILSHMPVWMCLEKKDAPNNYSGITWEATALKITVFHPMQEPSSFQSMSSAPDSGRSFTANLVFLDEWAFQEWAKEIWTGAYPLVNRPGGGQVIGLSTGKRGTLFEEEWNRAVKNESNFIPIFLNVWTDPRRDMPWYEQTQIDMPHSYRREYPVNPEDAFAVGEGAFFEEWNEDVHVIDVWDPPKDQRIYGAYDPGFATRACFKWYAMDKDERAICFREYYPHRTIDVDQAIQIIKMSCYRDGRGQTLTFKMNEEIHNVEVFGTPFNFYQIAADTDAWVRSRSSGKSTAEVFLEFGIVLSQASKDLSNGWMRLHQWLKLFADKDGQLSSLLRFTKDCQNTRRTYPSCECSKTNPEDISKGCEMHCQAVDRYFCMSRPIPKLILEENKILTGMDVQIVPKSRNVADVLKSQREQFLNQRVNAKHQVGTGRW